MTVLISDSNRLSNVVKHEYESETFFCRDQLTANDAAATWKVGAVLGSYLASPTATAGAVVGTGNGAMGSITMTASAHLVVGTYTLKITKAVTNAGDFELLDPRGRVIGLGQVGTAFSQAGFAFTLADGSTDFVAGDYIPITVAGTVKWKLVEATATDGTQIARAIYLSNALGNYGDTVLAATTDTTVLGLVRGPAIVAKEALTYGTSVSTAALKNVLYAQLQDIGILVSTQI